MLAVLIMTAMATGSFQMPASVDQDLVEEVESLVEAEGGRILATSKIDDVAWELGLDDEAVHDKRLHHWLPVVGLRASWSPPGDDWRKRWEILIFMTWPVG